MIDWLQTRDLPSEWREVTIGGAYNFTRRPRALKLEGYPTIPFVPMELVPSQGTSKIGWLDKSPDQITSGTYFERGDVLLSRITPSFENGKQGIADALPIPFAYGSTEIIPIQSRPEYSDGRFLFYLLLHPKLRAEIAARMEGSTGRQRVPESVVREWVIPLPPLPEQRAIADVLSRVQEAVEVEEELVRVTRELKQAALSQLFTHGLRGEPQKETEIGPVPESWAVLPLDKVVKARGGSAFPHSYQGKTSGDLPFYKVSDMNLPGNEVFMTRANHRLDRVSANELGAKPFPKDTIVFPKVGGALLTNKKRRLTCESLMDNNMMGVVSLDAGRCSPDFLQQWFETVDLRTLAAPGPLPSLNNARLYECLIPLPGPDEQRKIASILRTIDDKIAFHEERQRLLRELFRTLLHDLMTGHRRVAGMECATGEVGP